MYTDCRLVHAVSSFIFSLTAVRVTELVLLVAAIPGQVVFIRCLWTGRSFTLSVPLVLLYLLPNGLLPRFGQGSYNAVLGSSVVVLSPLTSDYSS